MSVCHALYKKNSKIQFVCKCSQTVKRHMITHDTVYFNMPTDHYTAYFNMPTLTAILISSD